MVRRNGVCVLLGAGASYDAKLPLSKQILTEFIEYIGRRQDNGTPYWCRSGQPWWQADIQEVQHTIRLIKSVNATDIEDLMRKLEARAYPRGDLSEESFQYGDIYQSVLRFIYWRLRTPETELIGYYNHLIDLRRFTGQKPLIVATLNWDCCVERALGWRNVSTGFNTRNFKIWTNGTFNLNRELWLIKLHGSLSWVDYSWRDMESALPDTKSPLMP